MQMNAEYLYKPIQDGTFKLRKTGPEYSKWDNSKREVNTDYLCRYLIFSAHYGADVH